MQAYEDVLSNTSTRHGPWFVIPADNKWFTRVAIADVIVDALESLDLEFPKVSKPQRMALAAARHRLQSRR